jgi:tetratricopeptide (TPR) repeat protein
MTDDTTAAAAHPYDGCPACESLAALREAHLTLRRALSDAADQSDSAARAGQIRTFLVGACKSGAFIPDSKERRVAQGILDFWSAELATSPEAQSSDFTSVLLAPFDATRTAAETDQPAQSKEDQRTLIRLSAMARQWQDSGKQAGYLLTGETIEEAAKFADRTPELGELVQESQRADRAIRRRKRNAAYFGLSVLLMFASIGTLFAWQFVALPKTSEALIRQVKESTSGEVQQHKLWWLVFLQRWLPPYDFSGTPKISDITLPDLKMWAPNFSRVAFGNVKFRNARLPAASFSQSTFFVDDKNPDAKNDFSGSDLTFSQYLGANIYATSFADSDLYRAAFDRAMLCDVDFSHADLRSASFWAASPDDKTYATLRKTVWWVAGGWNSSHLEKLLNSQGPNQPSGAMQSPAADIEAARQALKRSPRFCKDIAEPLAEAAQGTFDRAMALNDMAWTLATWGIDRDSAPTEDTCHVQSMPKNALEAADQAIGIIQDLKDKGGVDKDYPYWLANFRDTKAYILMQMDQMKEAKAIYEIDLEKTAADPAMLFRYAVTLFATGQEAEADKTFKASLDKQYLPRDELENLKRYIPLPVRQMAYKVIDDLYPSPKNIPLCQPLDKPN